MMLKLYKYLYKLTGYCPSFLQLRIQTYSIRRLKTLTTAGYYVGNPGQILEFWTGNYEIRLGLYRSSLKSYIRYFKNLLEVIWKTKKL